MRIRSLDLIRGLCVLFMLITHALSFWFVPSSMWLFTLEGITAGSICASGFVFISGASFGFSWAKNERAGIPQKEQYLKGIASAIVLYILAFSNNALAGKVNADGFASLFYWHLFQALAFSRLLGLLFVKVKRVPGIILVVGLIAFAAIFLQLIDYGQTSDPLKFTLFSIFFRRLDDYPIFVYFPFFLMGMVIGKEIQSFTEKPTLNLGVLKNWLLIGAIFMVAGVLLGFQLSKLVLGWGLLDWLSTYPFATLDALPFFLILDTYAWCVFFTGFQICLLMLSFYYWDIRPLKQTPAGKSSKKGMLDIFGKYSLTIYMAHMVIYAFPLRLDYLTIWLPTLAFVLVAWVVFWQLDRLGKGKISLEYVMGIFGEWLFRRFAGKSRHKKTPTTGQKTL